MRIVDLPSRIVTALFRTQEVLFFSKEGAEGAASVGLLELTQSDLEKIQLNPCTPWANQVGQAGWFADGGRLFALVRNGEHVSFGWAKHGDEFYVGEIGGTVRLTFPALWIWNCFTPPEHRGNGFYPTLLKGTRFAMGAPPTIIYCVRENTASRRGIERADFASAFSIWRHRLLVRCRNDVGKRCAGFERVWH